MFTMVLVLTFSPAANGGAVSKRAFIVHSYESNHVCGIPQSNGIENVLREHFGTNLTIRSHFMDTKTTNSTSQKCRRKPAKCCRQSKHSNRISYLPLMIMLSVKLAFIWWENRFQLFLRE